MVSPSSDGPQTIPSEDRFYSTPHKVKGCADDLAIMSQSPEEHQHLLDHLDICCHDVSLSIRPEKCYSLMVEGGKKSRRICQVSGLQVAIHVT